MSFDMDRWLEERRINDIKEEVVWWFKDVLEKKGLSLDGDEIVSIITDDMLNELARIFTSRIADNIIKRL